MKENEKMYSGFKKRIIEMTILLKISISNFQQYIAKVQINFCTFQQSFLYYINLWLLLNIRYLELSLSTKNKSKREGNFSGACPAGSEVYLND